MRPASSRLLAALRGPHVLYLRAVSYAPDGTPTELPIVDGSVTLDAGSETRGRCELTVASPVPPRRADGPLTPYGAWITVERGIRYADDTTEGVQLGRFRIENVGSDLADGRVKVSGFDASRAIQDDRFLSPRTILAGARYTDVLTTLARETIPSLAVSMPAITTTIGSDQIFERERWDAIRELSVAIGCESFVDGSGTFVVRPPPSPTAPAVWTIDAGPEGVLTDVTESMTRERAYNAVVAVGEAYDGDPPARGVAYDLSSPIAWGGPFGHAPRFYASSLLETDAQALAAATSILASELGVERSVEFSSVVNPALEPGDAIEIVYPDGHSEVHVLDSVSIPLGARGALSAQTRITSAATREAQRRRLVHA